MMLKTEFLEDNSRKTISEKCDVLRACSSPPESFRENDTSSTRFGIDTLRLSLAEFSIRSDNRLRIRKAASMRKRANPTARKRSVWRDRVIYVDNEGHQIYGDNAKWSSVETSAKIHVRHGLHGGLTCMVEFSVPRIDCGINYPAADQCGLKRALDSMQETLDFVGIETSIMEARLSRVDCCFDRQMAMPPSLYALVAECFHMPYEKARRFHLRDGSDGFCLGCGNNQVHLNVYDKSCQMKEQHGVDLGTLCNVLRCEVQLRSGAKIREVLKMTTAHDLLAQYDQLRGLYEELIRPAFAFGVDWGIYDTALKEWCKMDNVEVQCARPSTSLEEASLKNWRDCYARAYTTTRGTKGFDRLCQAVGHRQLHKSLDERFLQNLFGVSDSGIEKKTARGRAAYKRRREFEKEGRTFHILAQSLHNPWFLACLREWSRSILRHIPLQTEESKVLSKRAGIRTHRPAQSKTRAPRVYAVS